MVPVTEPWRIRPLGPDDSIEELTDLLHRGYAGLAERGLRYLASHQDVSTTRSRTAAGDCFVAEDPATGALLGTIVVHPPGARHGRTAPDEPAWYRRDDVAVFAQYCVDPRMAGRGLGRALHATAEAHARALGARELACDTAAEATDLIAMYRRWGYRIVDAADWDVTNYRSVVLSKTLDAPSDHGSATAEAPAPLRASDARPSEAPPS